MEAGKTNSHHREYQKSEDINREHHFAIDPACSSCLLPFLPHPPEVLPEIKPLPCVVFSIVTFAVMSLVSRIYKWRGKAVMSHYAKCRFNELLAVLLFFLAMAIICFMMYLLDKK